ncbi:MAG: type II toxin-antitoxin system VapC family toxin [Oscillospiraceae bacterium]|jgi:tRNA(fMet)-specific endonuclease VapC|nr:type II toxin-antitoxin system VapC family toxin [Oscillospiraceae bacterium]
MLDTNICIFVMNGNARVREIFTREQAGGITVSAVVLAELVYGMENSARRESNLETLRKFLTTVTILPFGEDAAIAYGHIRTKHRARGTPIGPLDTLIAAHALSLGMTLVTNNTREFTRVDGLATEDWCA